MEKLKSILSILSSLLLIMILVLIFSCEKKKTVTIVEDKNGDTIKTITTETGEDTSYINKFKAESHELEIKLKELGDKAKQKGGKMGNSIRERTNKMEGERMSFHSDSSNTKAKENWEEFKEKSRAAIDSLEKKLNH
jgi:hypothetical protein